MSFDAIRQVLSALEQQDGWQDRRQLQRVRLYWPNLVGAAVASHTRPHAIQRQVLQVATASPVWAQNLMYERSRILVKLNERFPNTLTDIRFSTAHWNYEGDLSPELEHDRIWNHHPSKISAPDPTASEVPPQTPEAAFRSWARRVQVRSQQLPLCPHCRCPAPAGELERWSVCSLCAAKAWSP
jgi:predicted nucleic acid-binding Zn ribbon protein